jgi:hypothetical protein
MTAPMRRRVIAWCPTCKAWEGFVPQRFRRHYYHCSICGTRKKLCDGCLDPPVVTNPRTNGCSVVGEPINLPFIANDRQEF